MVKDDDSYYDQEDESEEELVDYTLRPSTSTKSTVNHLALLREGLNTPSKEDRQLLMNYESDDQESYYEEEEEVGKGFDEYA